MQQSYAWFLKGKAEARKKPKRPTGAFSIFTEDFRKSFKMAFPEVKSGLAVGQAGGGKWKSMSATVTSPGSLNFRDSKKHYMSKGTTCLAYAAEGLFHVAVDTRVADLDSQLVQHDKGMKLYEIQGVFVVYGGRYYICRWVISEVRKFLQNTPFAQLLPRQLMVHLIPQLLYVYSKLWVRIMNSPLHTSTKSEFMVVGYHYQQPTLYILDDVRGVRKRLLYGAIGDIGKRTARYFINRLRVADPNFDRRMAIHMAITAASMVDKFTGGYVISGQLHRDQDMEPVINDGQPVLGLIYEHFEHLTPAVETSIIVECVNFPYDLQNKQRFVQVLKASSDQITILHEIYRGEPPQSPLIWIMGFANRATLLAVWNNMNLGGGGEKISAVFEPDLPNVIVKSCSN